MYTKRPNTMPVVTLFVLAQNRRKKKLQWPSTVEWISKLCCVYTKEYCKAMEINKLLHTAMRVDVTNIVMSQEATLSKDYTLAYFIYRKFKNRQSCLLALDVRKVVSFQEEGR